MNQQADLSPDQSVACRGAFWNRWLCCIMPTITSVTNAQGQLDPGLQKLLMSLDHIQQKLNCSADDVKLLKQVLQGQGFQSLFKVHEKVTAPSTQELKPLTDDAHSQSKQVCQDLSALPNTKEITELQQILIKPHIQALFKAHDRVAIKDYDPHLPEIPHAVDEDETSIKIIRIMRNREPLGATIRHSEATGVIQIARVMHGGAADRTGFISVGDQVLEVNGVKVTRMDPDKVVSLLTGTVGPITLKLVPGDAMNSLLRESKMRVRAHFSYDPAEDKIIPCPEAGLSFKKGDILHIVSQDDVNWWQARREGDRNMRAGLIPGKLLQEKREAIKRGTDTKSSVGKENIIKVAATKSSSKFSPKLQKKLKKTKKLLQSSQPSEECDTDEIITYEEVEKYYPKAGIYRPIVLIGPPGVGRNELKKRLLSSNTGHYKSTVPYTTRPQRDTEIDGEVYFFIDRQEMEKDIQEKKFIEYGEFKGNLYGTSMDSIRALVNAGHVAVMTAPPQALKQLKTPDLKPYVVNIKPPHLDRLRETRTASNAKTAMDDGKGRSFTEEELQEMIQNASRIESQYGHYIDHAIINDDLNSAVNELILAAERLETDPQWVPACWLR